MVELRKLRLKHGWTQKRLADAVAVSRQMIGFIESGKARPGICLAKRIANELDFDWTLFYTDK